MRLPSGDFSHYANLIGERGDFAFYGCLSFEQRCIAGLRSVVKSLPMAISEAVMLRMVPPDDAFPNRRSAIENQTNKNGAVLRRDHILYNEQPLELLASEDILIDVARSMTNSKRVILDITSLPKRYFCFLLKRLMVSDNVRDALILYTSVGVDGYASDHLAEDPLPAEYLPGFASGLEANSATLVFGTGFEALNVRSIFELHQYQHIVKIVMSYPPNGGAIRRQINTLRVLFGDTEKLDNVEIRMIASWDTEQVYNLLSGWSVGERILSFAPYGPKPHTLAMALHAIKHGRSMYYTQPKSYNPFYTKGIGSTRAYLVKFDGIACYDRNVTVM